MHNSFSLNFFFDCTAIFSILALQKINMKQNLLKFLLLTILLSLTSCLGDDVDIESNRRILVKGKVVDILGNPLPDISVVTSAHGDALGQTHSDASGNFSLISLDEQFDPLDIFINVDNFYNIHINYDFSNRSYYSETHNKTLLHDLGTIVLGKRATLNLTFNNLPGDENTLVYKIKYTPANCELPLNVFDPPENCDLAASFQGELDPISENRTIFTETVLGTNAILEYSLNFEAAQTIEIPLTNLATNYVFVY